MMLDSYGRMARFRLSRNGVKHMAMAAMALNHIGQMFFPAGDLTGQVLIAVGYFTAPVMCWFLVEGFYATSSRRAYFMRLFVCAAVSQVPYAMCFGADHGLNMLVTLSICFTVLLVRNSEAMQFVKVPVQIMLIVLTARSDWPVIAPVAVILFDLARDGRCPRYAGFLPMALAGMSVFGFDTGSALGDLALGVMGPAAAMLVIFCLYGPDRRPGRSYRFWQYYFYAFYSAHLSLLALAFAFLRF